MQSQKNLLYRTAREYFGGGASYLADNSKSSTRIFERSSTFIECNKYIVAHIATFVYITIDLSIKIYFNKSNCVTVEMEKQDYEGSYDRNMAYAGWLLRNLHGSAGIQH